MMNYRQKDLLRNDKLKSKEKKKRKLKMNELFFIDKMKKNNNKIKNNKSKYKK